MSLQIRLDHVAFDAGTQIREAIDQQVVSDYADAMTAGATFPPIVLFHDGTQYYLADGFHRFMAAQRLTFKEINADVQPGTKEDALWFALGANRANGKRLTEIDKRHAIILAIETWPDRSTRQIAGQVGCTFKYVAMVKEQVCITTQLPDQVIGSDGKAYPASQKVRTEKAVAIEQMLRDGVGVMAIVAALKTSQHTIERVRQAVGLERQFDRTQTGVKQRRERMREMASGDYTSRQIAAELGLSEEGCRATLKKEGIDVPADRAVGHTKRHDANRIVERIVMDAENLTEGVNLIDFSEIDAARLTEWLRSLTDSRDKFSGFIRRLMKEKQKHGQAA